MPQGTWSQQETLLLLEGLEMFGDDWTEVADHVGTKSAVGQRVLNVECSLNKASCLCIEDGSGSCCEVHHALRTFGSCRNLPS